MKAHIKFISHVFVPSVALLLAGCGATAKSIWNNAIKQCAKNDQLGSNVVFFGPSNTFGPGTTFTKLSDGAIQGSYLPKDYSLPSDVVHKGADFSCDVLRTKGFALDAKIPISEAIGLPADLGLALKTASSTTVKASAIQWDELLVGQYNDHVGHLDEENNVRKSLLRGDMVLTRALRVHGLEATVKFSANVAPNIKATIPSAIPNASTGVEFSTTWTDDTTMVIKATADFYIAGELHFYKPFGLSGSEIGPIVPNQGALEVHVR